MYLCRECKLASLLAFLQGALDQADDVVIVMIQLAAVMAMARTEMTSGRTMMMRMWQESVERRRKRFR